FSCGAYPLEDIHDPTGAGDTFAGGMAGYLAGTVKKVHFNDLRKAMIYGSVLASFCVEAFSLERLRKLSMEEIAKRYETFKFMSQFEVPVSCFSLRFLCGLPEVRSLPLLFFGQPLSLLAPATDPKIGSSWKTAV